VALKKVEWAAKIKKEEEAKEELKKLKPWEVQGEPKTPEQLEKDRKDFLKEDFAFKHDEC